jgi:hypothetical protein
MNRNTSLKYENKSISLSATGYLLPSEERHNPFNFKFRKGSALASNREDYVRVVL